MFAWTGGVRGEARVAEGKKGRKGGRAAYDALHAEVLESGVISENSYRGMLASGKSTRSLDFVEMGVAPPPKSFLRSERQAERLLASSLSRHAKGVKVIPQAPAAPAKAGAEAPKPPRQSGDNPLDKALLRDVSTYFQ